MSDPHVVSLTYVVKPSDEVSYRDPPRLEFEAALFTGVLDEGTLTLKPKDHYPSINAAREPADRFLRAWELDATLRGGRGSLAFEYRTGEVIDRDPPPPGSPQHIEVQCASHAFIGCQASIHLTRGKYPEPPEYFQFTPDIEVLWGRIEGYRLGRESLLSMAYFCLTWLERQMATGRAEAARVLNTEKSVLDKLGELTSERGDSSMARKASRSPQPLSDAERVWIIAALEKLLHNVGKLGKRLPPRITLKDLPEL